MPDFFAPSRGKVPVEISVYGADNLFRSELGVANLTSAGAASATWPSANLAIYMPFWIEDVVTATKIWWQNGATASGNLDVGIYDENGNLLVSIGTTGQTGTSTIQQADITDTTLPRGYYYLAMAMNGTTGTTLRYSPTTNLQQMMGVLEQASAFVLPSTATFAKAARSYIPVMGIQFYRAVGI